MYKLSLSHSLSDVDRNSTDYFSGACFFGFIAGKASYQGECKRKIFEQIPDSDFARRLRAGVSGFTNNEPYVNFFRGKFLMKINKITVTKM